MGRKTSRHSCSDRVHVLALLAVLLGIFMVMMSAWSVALALTTKEISGFASVVNGLSLPALLLAGVLLPLSVGPGWLRVLGHLDPLSYVVEAARSLAAGTVRKAPVWEAFAVVVPPGRGGARVGDPGLPPGGLLRLDPPTIRPRPSRPEDGHGSGGVPWPTARHRSWV
ncbi:MAG TPA: ABC transporter permease [Acidimicrobiales bacterium]|nr:ABC transporter permease [Acidimicrobiales bacterium]